MSITLQVQPRDEQTEGDCPECGGQIRPDGTEQVCEDCGCITGEDTLDRTGGTKAHLDEDRTKRTGPQLSVTRHDRGLSTAIGRFRDGTGEELKGKVREKFARLRTHHSRAQFQDKRERNRAGAFVEIDRMTSALGMGQGREEQACQLFRTIHDAEALFGRSIEGVASACVYAVVRLNQDPITATEVGAVSRVETLEVKRAYRWLNRTLELPTPPPRAEAHLPKIVSAVECSTAVETTAETLIDAWREAFPEHSGATARGTAAAAVYLAAMYEGEKRTQVAIAEVAGSSVVTLRERKNQMQTLGVSA